MSEELKSRILKIFIERYPDLAHSMNDCFHAYSDNKPNLFHICNSVWSHTMMVLKLIETSDDHLLNLARIISAICHDVGKVRTRTIKDETKKVRFFNHEYASIQHTIDFIYYLESIGFIDDLEVEILIEICLPVVSNHLEGFQREMGFNEFMKFTNHQKSVARVLVDLMKADNAGRFHLTEDYQDSSDSRLTTFNNYVDLFLKVNTDDKKPIYLMGGVAGCGKDYIAENMYIENAERVILSFDQIRLQLFKENNTIYGGMTPTDIYNQAFLWSCEKKIDFAPIMRRQIDEAHSQDKVVIISNTNCTRKARRSLIGSIGNGLRKTYAFHMIYVISDINTILERNRGRVNDKCLGDDIVFKFAYNQQIPTMLEDFSSVTFISN